MTPIEIRHGHLFCGLGWLAKGINLPNLGRSVTDHVMLDLAEPTIGPEGIRGEVVRVDRFGNLITNIDHKRFEKVAGEGPVAVKLEGHDISRIVSTYGEAAASETCALFGSTDHLEIAVQAGNAAERFGLGRGAKVTVLHPI